MPAGNQLTISDYAGVETLVIQVDIVYGVGVGVSVPSTLKHTDDSQLNCPLNLFMHLMNNSNNHGSAFYIK